MSKGVWELLPREECARGSTVHREAEDEVLVLLGAMLPITE